MKEPKDYIVFPLDLPRYEDALSYAKKLRGKVGLFKVGLELFISQGPGILPRITDLGEAEIFLDLKLHDIPVTMKRAFLAASMHGPKFVTVHCDQGEGFLKDLAEKKSVKTMILAITLLTSLNKNNLAKLGYAEEYIEDLSKLVLNKSKMARDAGCQGIVCSGHEVKMVKRELGSDFIAVTPGIRPTWSVVEKDDQKRIVTPADAVSKGADYLVIGRPIRDAEDPAIAAELIAEEIASVI